MLHLATTIAVSTWRRAYATCSSVNRDFFTEPSLWTASGGGYSTFDLLPRNTGRTSPSSHGVTQHRPEPLQRGPTRRIRPRLTVPDGPRMNARPLGQLLLCEPEP